MAFQGKTIPVFIARLSRGGMITFIPPCNPSNSVSLSAADWLLTSSTNCAVEDPALMNSRTFCSDTALRCFVRWLASPLLTRGLEMGMKVIGCVVKM